MSHFYGTVQGNRGQTTRCGSKNSGLETVAASYQGAVCTTLNEHNGEDWAKIEFIPWEGAGVSHVLYEGPLNPTMRQIAMNVGVPFDRW